MAPSTPHVVVQPGLPPGSSTGSLRPPLRLIAVLLCLAFRSSLPAQGSLPEAPSTLLLRDSFSPANAAGSLGLAGPQTTSPTRGRRCKPAVSTESPEANASAAVPYSGGQSCPQENPIQSVVTRPVTPLSPTGKAELAARDIDDPFNLITIAGYSGIAIASNAHSAFGPGFTGWGRLTGYSLLEDAQGEFVGTFLIPSIVREDPRYHRLPEAPFKRRLLHAIAHTYVSQHDDGTPMINYATLINYPVSAELANLYVPGIQDNAPDTVRRIAIGIAPDPAGTLVAEFLPDVARHIHVHIIFVQEIVNKVVTGGTAPNVQ